MNKTAYRQCFDAGQAAQRDHLREDVTPFSPDSDEGKAWLEGYEADLHEKWLPAGGESHRLTVGEGE